MRVGVVGAGAVGARAARQLVSSTAVARVLIDDEDEGRAAAVVASLGDDQASVSDSRDVDVAVLTLPGWEHAVRARELLERGVPVVSVADGIDDVRALLELDGLAREREVSLVIGAGFSPGLTCVLAAHAAASLDQVDEVHIAKVGTGGPSCAQAHHRALAGEALDWRDGAWVTRRAGSGRELCWFPDPVGGADCYRAALPDALLLEPAFPGVERITARLGANRRDRITARLPMLRPPHPEGGPGGIRVEVRGRRGTARVVQVLGAMDRPAVAAGTVSAVAAVQAGLRELRRPGAGGLAELVDPLPFLSDLAQRGVKAAVFEGAA
ncbi:MAG TPA: Gfo/Idh/MocA family oxidoreductase [Acidimicrobiales bacterium]|nr:Gfo/Idh/MocA family oxidoreductase [Acidimicrobiales bacterium]